jgi:putative DNA primase/helicase
MEEIIDELKDKYNYLKDKIDKANLTFQYKMSCSLYDKLNIGNQIKIMEDLLSKFNLKCLDDLKIEIKNKVILKDTKNATELIVNYILSNNYIYSLRDDNKQEVWIYRDGIYIPDAISYIKEISRDLLGIAYTNHMCNNVVSKIEATTFIDYHDFFNVRNPYKIAVKNGILDLQNNKLYDFTPKEIYFNKINAEYNEKYDCPIIKKFFLEILQSEDDIKVIQELFGFSLVKDYFIEKAFMFNGNGRNGKGKTFSLLESFLGKSNVSNISLENIKHDGFFLCNLHNRMVNIGGDIGSQKLKDTNAFKSVTGRDDIQANRKNKKFVEFKNYAKMLFACNTLPETSDTTDGFYDRWILLDFPYKFVDKKTIETAKDEEKKYFKLIDTNIINKLTTQEELNGLLNWSLIGLKRLFDNEDFSYNKTSKDVRKLWEIKANSFLYFCNNFIETSENDEVERSVLLSSYNEFCKKYKVNPQNGAIIKKNLIEKFGSYSERSGHKNISVYKYIRLKEVCDKATPKIHWYRNFEIPRLSKNTCRFVALEYLQKYTSPILIEDLYKNLKNKVNNFENLISELKEEGLIYEPKKGYIKLVEA